jgi:hypothetical protein
MNWYKTFQVVDIAYHSSNIDYNTVRMSGGLSNLSQGSTVSPVIPHDIFLPKNRIFLAKYKNIAENYAGRYIYVVNISGMKKYPDLTTFADYGGYFEQNGEIWFKDQSNIGMPENLKRFIERQEGTIHSDDVSGEDTWELLGTCVVEAPVDMSRIIKVIDRK